MAHVLLLTILLVPHSHSPIVRASQEDRALLLVPEGIAPHSVDGSRVAVVVFKVLLRVRHRALMNCAVLRRREVVNSAFVALGEIDGKSTGVDEGHATSLLVDFSSGIHIFLVRVGLSLELHEFSELKSLLHGPLNDTAVARNRDQGLSLVVSLHPLDFPNDVAMLTVKVTRLRNGLGVMIAHIVDSNVTMRVTNSNQMGLFLGELATSDTVLGLDDSLGEVGVFQRPEAEKTWLENAVVSAVNIELTVTDSDQIGVGHIDVHAGNLAAFREITLEGEELLDLDFALLEFFLLILLLLFLLLLLLHLLHEQGVLLLGLFVILVVEFVVLAKVDWWVVLVQDVLLVVLRLSEKTFDDTDGLHHGVGESDLNILDLLGDVGVVADHSLG